jgi:hypothetical protein
MRKWIWRRTPLLAVAALVVVAVGGTALAGPAGSVKTFTGCLSSGDGVIAKVKEGDAPKSPCNSGQTLVRLSGGDITKISVTGGLTLPNGGESGDVTISLDPKYSLPQSCSQGEVAKWNSATSAWVCAADNDTQYSAGTGLDLTGTTFGIEPAYRVKNTPDCSSGQFATGFDSDGDIQCAAPSAGGVHAYSAHVGETTLAGDTLVISKTLPPGTYLLFASVSLVNRDGDGAGDGVSAAECRIPGYQTGTQGLFWNDEFGTVDTKESVALSSAISHAGGAIELRCEESAANVDVWNATLTAIKVDSLG